MFLLLFFIDKIQKVFVNKHTVFYYYYVLTELGSRRPQLMEQHSQDDELQHFLF